MLLILRKTVITVHKMFASTVFGLLSKEIINMLLSTVRTKSDFFS